MADPVRPTRATTNSKVLGRNVLVFLNYGEGATESVPVWTLVGGQKTADFSSSADDIDVSDKVSGGYGETAAGIKNTELEMELLVKSGDAPVKELFEAHEGGEDVHILMWVKNGRSVTNWYSITEIKQSAAHDDAAVLTMTLKGLGQPTFTDNMTDPRS